MSLVSRGLGTSNKLIVRGFGHVYVVVDPTLRSYFGVDKYPSYTKVKEYDLIKTLEVKFNPDKEPILVEAMILNPEDLQHLEVIGEMLKVESFEVVSIDDVELLN